MESRRAGDLSWVLYGGVEAAFFGEEGGDERKLAFTRYAEGEGDLVQPTFWNHRGRMRMKIEDFEFHDDFDL